MKTKDKNKVIIVDDHEIFRDGLKFVLSQSETVEVIAEAVNGEEYLKLLDIFKPDLVLMDISMPQMDGIEATRMSTLKYPEIKIVALSMFGEQEYYFKMLSAGAKGFILKKSGKNDLEKAIEEVMLGNSFFSHELLRNMIVSFNKSANSDADEIKNFSKRELEVLELICQGLSNIEIGEKLNLSHKTIDGHRTHLIAKTGSRNSINLVMYAIKHNLVQL